MTEQISLPKSDMSFELKDGTLLKIHKDDVQKLAIEICIQAGFSVIEHAKRFAGISQKIKIIRAIIAENKDMDKKIKDQYLEQMLTEIKAI